MNQEKSHDKRRNPNNRLVYGLLFGIGALLYAGTREPAPQTPVTEVRTVETLSFEEARKVAIDRDPNEKRVVQAYLDHILDNRDEYSFGLYGWESIDRLVYDPNYEIMHGEYAKQGIEKIEFADGYGGSGTLHLMSVPLHNLSQKALVYVAREALTYTISQDELLSLIDNEAWHAGFNHKSVSHLDFTVEDVSKDGLGLLMMEIYSFDLQFIMIDTGRRRVAEDFKEGIMLSAHGLFRRLESIAEEETPRSREAQRMYNIMLEQPTLPYFVEPDRIAGLQPYAVAE